MKYLPQIVIFSACLVAFVFAVPILDANNTKNHTLKEFEEFHSKILNLMDGLAKKYKDEDYVQHFTEMLHGGMVELKQKVEEVAEKETDPKKKQETINFAYESVERLRRFIEDVKEKIDQ